MKVLVVGSNEWSNYSEVIRQFTLILEDMKYNDDNNLLVVHSGNKGAENMTTEYVGKIEKFMKQKGFTIKEKVLRGHNKLNMDYEIISEGADLALVFTTNNCKRSAHFTKILTEFNIPTKVIKD
jgi:hypothetical protein